MGYSTSAVRIIESMTRSNTKLGSKAFQLWTRMLRDPSRFDRHLDPAQCVELAAMLEAGHVIIDRGEIKWTEKGKEYELKKRQEAEELIAELQKKQGGESNA